MSDVGFRLSPSQEAIWLNGGGRADCIAVLVLAITGRPAVAALRQALHAVLMHHEALRTRLAARPGVRVPLQVIETAPVLELREVGACSAGELHDLALGSAVELERGPRLRALFACEQSQVTRLAITLPALFADLSSLRVLAQDLARALSGSGLGEAPVQYADFAAMAQERARGQAEPLPQSGAEQQHVALRPILRWPPGETFAPQRLLVPVPGATQIKLQALEQRAGASPGTALLAIFAITLSRFADDWNFPVGVVQSGRTAKSDADLDLAGAVGLYAACVPVTLALGPSLSFWECIESLRAAGRGAPVVPASSAFLLEVESRPFTDEQTGDIRVERELTASHPYRFALKVVKAAEDLALYVDTVQVPLPLATSIAAAMAALAEAAVKDEALAVGSLPLLGEAERTRLLAASIGPLPGATPDLILSLFATQSARYPERIAVRDQHGELAYAALSARADGLALALQAAGVGPGTVVGLLLDRSVDAVVGILGIFKAGGAYVPLSVEAPRARVHELLQGIGVSVLVTDRAGLDTLGSYGGQVVRVDQGPEASLTRSAHVGASKQSGPRDLAYVIYTSGSTGVPKAVAIEHLALARYTDAISARLRDVLTNQPAEHPLHFAMVSTLSADLGHTCLFPALTMGGCLHLIDRTTSLDAAAFARYCRAHPIDILKVTPPHLSALLHGGQNAAAVLPRLALFTGGETLPWELARQIQALRPGLVHFNHYGPTETTVGALMMQVRLPVVGREPHPWVPLGRPLPGVTAYVLDAQQALSPDGAVGELFLGGHNLAREYLRQPEQTAARFVPDPWSAPPGARLYRTGDRVQRLPDGTIGFLGRKDRQLKLRGFRIEPAEIEAACRRIAGVRAVHVMAREDAAGEKRLIAYAVFASAATPPELLRALSAVLPEPLVPSAVVPLAALPLTENGKVDESALPLPQQPAVAASVLPRDEVETQLAAMWCALLRLEQVGIHDNFFDLGGQSLVVTQLLARIGDTYQVDLPVHVVFDGPTIAELAAAIRQAHHSEQPPSGQLDDLGALVDELEGVDADELRRLLAESP